MALSVTAAEIVSGALLILGIYARPVAALMAFELLGAASVHFGERLVLAAPKRGCECPVFLVVATVAVALLGEGAYALRPTIA